MPYMIGVDGGATGTIAVAADEKGHILASATGSAGNYLAVGQEEARAALHQVIHNLLQKTGSTIADCQMAVFGLAGLNHENDALVYHSLLEPLGFGKALTVKNDIVIAWAAATACQPGVVVISGTGSSAFGINRAGQEYKALGWDYILADQGSGYWVGLQGIQTAIKAWDGRLEESLLLPALLNHYNLKDASEMMVKAYSAGFDKPEIASFSALVSRCAEQGDAHAQRILAQAGTELGLGVCAVIKRLGMEKEIFTVGLVGGTFRSGQHLLESFSGEVHRLAPGANIGPVKFPPVLGAIMLAHHLNGSLTPTVLENLAETSKDSLRWKG